MIFTNDQLKSLSDRIKADIDAYCLNTYFEPNSGQRLGVGAIGEECERKLWGKFRWLIRHEPTTARQQRLFNRGHREEARFIEWLQGIGFKIWYVDEAERQFRVKAIEGHFSGALDGVGVSPYPELNEPVLLEFKTNATGATFAKLFELGVRVHKPKHYKQICTYGKEYGFRYCLYLCINKNDDDLYVELVEIDWNIADENLARADRIINSKVAPHKISASETYYKCKGCYLAGICHRGEPPEKNCRSCLHAMPAAAKQWNCELHRAIIPDDVIPNGCDNWERIV